MGFRVLQGRGIDERDVAEAPPVAVVNEAFVARYLPEGVDPLTRSIIGDPVELLPDIQGAVWSIDPALPVFEVATMEALIERRVGSYGIIAELMAAFALLSLLLGAVGIYGVTAHVTAQWRGEIGVRLAMGAKRGDVVRMVLLQGAGRMAAGLLIGLGAAFGLAGPAPRARRPALR